MGGGRGMKFRPEAEVWPLMSNAQLEALAEDIDRRGQQVPIYLYEGEILDGRNRWLAITRFCKKVTEPKFDAAVTDSPIEFVVSLNEQRRHLTESQRALAAAKALPFYEAEAKKRQAEAGKSHGRGQAASSGPIEPQLSSQPRRAADEAAKAFGTSTGSVKRGKTVATKGSKGLVDAVEAGELSLGRADQIVRETPDRRQQDAEVVHIRKSRMATRVRGLTGEIEWYTPRQYLDAAVEVMGGIELDPASSDAAQQHVGAERWFTLTDDGLAQPWSGTVFLNPPYAMPAIKQFVNKLVDSVMAGDVSEAILLTNNATDTEWFHTAAEACAGVCFTRGRISFLQARDGELLEKCSPTHGQAFFYFGSNLRGFKTVFSAFGMTFRRAA
jgi:phage N-6-adenine-methyltransferase